MKPEEKLLICLNCEGFLHEKCKYTGCSNCWNNIIKAIYGKCPKNKWKVPEILIE